MKTAYARPNGFSMLEALIALGIGGVFLTSVFTMWVSTAQIWHRQSIETRLHYSLETALEHLKHDVRLADGNNILFYPAGAAEYSAISLPSPVLDASGFQTFGPGGGIQWSRTVLYHVFTPEGGPSQLRMTVIPTFETNTALRQAELDGVVASGAASGGATTRTLFSADTVDLAFTPESPQFDGYAATTERSEKITFGSVRMTAGTHQIRFTVTGKNDLSANYKMGLDQLSITPSGSARECEAMTVSASSGDAQVIEDMSAFGANVWGGNNHLEYQSGSLGDQVTFQAYYDGWFESNFADMTLANAEVVNSDPALTVLSREDQAMVSTWSAAAQAQGSAQVDYPNFSNRTIRQVIQGGFVTQSAVMIRLKFTAAATQSLRIGSAYFGLRNGAGPNFQGIPTQLYFDNPTVTEGNPDGVGAVGAGTVTTKDVPAGDHVWSNWFIYTIDTTNPVPDHLVSYYVPAGAFGVVGWPDTPNIHSYEVNDLTGAFAGSTADLTDAIVNPGGVQNNDYVLGAAEMSGWQNVGVATSQVYDTKLTAPAYVSCSWTSVLPNASTVLMKVRTSVNADMAGAAAWNAVAGGVSSPMALNGIGNQRYVQFQATLTMGNPFTAYPTLDNVAVTWPGNDALVEIGGYVTKRADYGMFKITVDGQDVVNALRVDLDAQETFRGKDYGYSVNTQVKPKNTGK